MDLLLQVHRRSVTVVIRFTYLPRNGTTALSLFLSQFVRRSAVRFWHRHSPTKPLLGNGEYQRNGTLADISFYLITFIFSARLTGLMCPRSRLGCDIGNRLLPNVSRPRAEAYGNAITGIGNFAEAKATTTNENMCGVIRSVTGWWRSRMYGRIKAS